MPKEEFSENVLIEQPAIALFGELKWETADCFHEFEQVGGSPLGRETAAEVVLVRRLRAALEKLNRRRRPRRSRRRSRSSLGIAAG